MGFPAAPLDRRLPERESLGAEVGYSLIEPSRLTGDIGEGIEENSVPEGEFVPQPNKAAKGDAAPGDLGSGLLSCCGVSAELLEPVSISATVVSTLWSCR